MEVELNNSYSDNCHEYLEDIPVIDNNITYDDFFRNYLMKNQACLIKNITLNWESAQYWQSNDSPNFLYLNSKYGNSSVTVQNCNDQHFGTAKCSKWKFKEYIEYWMTYIKNGYPKDEPLYYLKDWHLKNESTDTFYEIPLYFTSDWLNEYLMENSLDDYRFVYMGAKGTWTPFHVDVMTSYSWSSNICGRKKWILFLPGEEKKFLDSLGNFPSDISQLKGKAKYFEIVQNSGDAIFVPSNWYHQVWNLDDTISINHNWINGTNLKNIWYALEKNLCDVKTEISDCNDMEGFLNHCQVMLKASFGMDFVEFYKFFSHIAYKRLHLIEKDVPIVLTRNYILGKNHAMYDLKCIKDVLNLFINHEDIHKIDSFKNFKVQPVELLNRMQSILL